VGSGIASKTEVGGNNPWRHQEICGCAGEGYECRRHEPVSGSGGTLNQENVEI
jgi:hypothetical protein